LRMDFIEIFTNRQGLGEHTIGRLQSGHKPLRIEGQITGPRCSPASIDRSHGRGTALRLSAMRTL
jgi:hypothetical protein